MRSTPLLVVAYNRPDKMRGLIEALRPLAPALVMVVVDGPKPGNAADADRVQQVRDAVSGIDWKATVLTRFRPVNVGLRASVTDAVSWAIAEYGQVAVIEEDVLPGPAFLPYVEHMLERYRGDDRIAHISGYDVVPVSVLPDPSVTPNRLTRYPESIAWATWDRAWKNYDDTLGWPAQHPERTLRAVVGSSWAARKWIQNFADARAGRISTWAYRWIASMWSHGQLILSPNVNLVSYVGHDDGTHTVTKQRWQERERYDGPVEPLLAPGAELVPPAEEWVNRVVFLGTPFGVARGVLVSIALSARAARRRRRARGTGGA